MKTFPVFAVRRKAAGFTLVELSIVLLIVGLLLGGLLPTLSAQVDQRHIDETRKQLNEIKQALIGFAMINGRLPCPASSTSNGIESFASGGNATNGNCSNFYDGFVPAATLGLPATSSTGLTDAWGNPLHYAVTLWSSSTPAVTNVFTRAGGMASVGISGLNPASLSFLLVCSTSTGINVSTPSCSNGSTTLTSSPGAPVVFFSTGKNGGQGGVTPDEAANLANTRVFISHDFVQNGFDDMVVWLSANTLIDRMVAAGKLP